MKNNKSQIVEFQMYIKNIFNLKSIIYDLMMIIFLFPAIRYFTLINESNIKIKKSTYHEFQFINVKKHPFTVNIV